MAPAYEGLVAVLNENAPVAMLTNIMKKCPKFKEQVIPKIVNEAIKSFENSDKNFVRSVNILYKGGIESKQKYNAIRASLTMCLDETGLTRKHIHFMKNISVPKLLTYKKLLQRVNQINIGELNDVRETFCYEMEEENNVNGKYRDLLQLLLKMAHFYLSANKHRNDTLNWFGKQEGSFKVTVGGDGAPFGKDDQALSWLVSFLNCGQRVCSSEENFLLFGANCAEDCEPVRRYVMMLKGQMTEIERKTYSIQVDGKEKVVSFTFELLPNDTKHLAFLGGELSISASFFSPFADVKKEEINNLHGSFGSDPTNRWHPWKYEERLGVAIAVEKKKVELRRSTLKPATKREKLLLSFHNRNPDSNFLP